MALADQIILRGTRVAQPAAAAVTAGALYCVTDEGRIVERSTGAAWESYSSSAGSGDVTASGTLTASRLIVGGGTTVVSALASLGTTTTLLHGNAAGAPTFGAVALAADVSGDLPFANLTQIAGLSVLGVTAGSTADVAAITAGTDGHVLTRVSSSSLAFAAPAAASGGLVLVQQQTASASATLDFTTWYSSTYDEYWIDILGTLPATDSATLQLKVSTDGGTSWEAGTSYKYAYRYASTNGSSGVVVHAGTSSINMGGGTENTTSTSTHTGHLRLFNPGSATRIKALAVSLQFFGADGNYYGFDGGAWWATVTAVNGLRFAFDSGNIAEGTIRIYGVVK